MYAKHCFKHFKVTKLFIAEKYMEWILPLTLRSEGTEL